MPTVLDLSVQDMRDKCIVCKRYIDEHSDEESEACERYVELYGNTMNGETGEFNP